MGWLESVEQKLREEAAKKHIKQIQEEFKEEQENEAIEK